MQDNAITAKLFGESHKLYKDFTIIEIPLESGTTVLKRVSLTSQRVNFTEEEILSPRLESKEVHLEEVSLFIAASGEGLVSLKAHPEDLDTVRESFLVSIFNKECNFTIPSKPIEDVASSSEYYSVALHGVLEQKIEEFMDEE